MIDNRELNLDDYLAIFRRRFRLILILALLASVVGLAVSYLFAPRYVSRSLVVVEKQTVPAGYVRPIVTASAVDRIAALQQQVFSRSRLEPLVTRFGLVRRGKPVDEAIAELQQNVSIAEADPPGPASNLRRSADFLGFYLAYTADSPGEAQQVCGELTSMLLAENLKMREQVAVNTTDFLVRQLADAKSNLDEKDKQLAIFKGRYLGQLPSDVENNLRILNGLNSQLDANTQLLSRAQQDKAYAESNLTQQIANWKSSQSSLTSENIDQRLLALQTQLIAMQTRYTDDYPEVIRMKNDVAALKAKQKEIRAENGVNSSSDTTEGKAEPASIQQLRQQIHQSEVIITRGAEQQKQLQATIDSYQGRLTLSPQVEEQYKQLTRDYDVARHVYDTLLLNKSESEIQTDLERRQQGEQMRLLDPASWPEFPSFPVRWRFAGGGLGIGLAVSLCISFWLEIRDKAIRDERDVQAAVDLPTLTSIPWFSPTVKAEESDGFSNGFKTLLGQ